MSDWATEKCLHFWGCFCLFVCLLCLAHFKFSAHRLTVIFMCAHNELPIPLNNASTHSIGNWFIWKSDIWNDRCGRRGCHFGYLIVLCGYKQLTETRLFKIWEISRLNVLFDGKIMVIMQQHLILKVHFPSTPSRVSAKVAKQLAHSDGIKLLRAV